MATIFLALAVAMSMIIDRPWWHKAIIILSAIPIALLVNVIRIVITALLFLMLGSRIRVCQNIFPRLGGLVYDSDCAGFMYLEIQILDHAFVEESTTAPQASGFESKATVRRPIATRAQ